MSSISSPARLTVFCLRPIVEVGLKAMRATMCSPFDSPPWMPPDLHKLDTVKRLLCKAPAGLLCSFRIHYPGHKTPHRTGMPISSYMHTHGVRLERMMLHCQSRVHKANDHHCCRSSSTAKQYGCRALDSTRCRQASRMSPTCLCECALAHCPCRIRHCVRCQACVSRQNHCQSRCPVKQGRCNLTSCICLEVKPSAAGN